MDDRELILAGIGQSGTKSRVSQPAVPLPKLPNDILWEMFTKRLEDLGGRIGTLEDLEVILSRPHYLDNESAARLGREPGGTPIWEAEVGVTTADLAIAETGSILISTGPGKPRLASLTPTVHVALVPRDRIVASLTEAFSQLSDRSTAMITGPSRTADIEGILVRGVHGPGDVVVIPV